MFSGVETEEGSVAWSENIASRVMEIGSRVKEIIEADQKNRNESSGVGMAGTGEINQNKS